MYGNEELQTFLKGCVELPEMGYYDYEWEQFISYYDPTSGMFYWIADSGCSCNSPWDEITTIGDMQVGRKDEFLRAADSFGDGGVYGYGQGRYSDQFETIRRAVSDL